MDKKSLLSIIVPAYNEERIISASIEKLHGFLSSHLDCSWEIVVADNGSRDGTIAQLMELSQRYPQLRWFHREQAGKGGAIKQAIRESQASALCFMDADLSTDLAYLPPLLAALDQGYDIAIGSRLLKNSVVERSFKREFLSRGFNLLERTILRTRFSDAHCGFKAFTGEALRDILPRIKDDGWFFDSELLVYAHRKGLKVKELAIRWQERRESRVRVLRVVFYYSVKLLMLRFRLFWEQFCHWPATPGTEAKERT